ncbi:putative F-box protein At3g52320 [Silene latifolia]|uniref:putative F-box protein At3g52320 n=1 Tax=Silene latifolia TaxID=37657 RepID=UPI003D76F1CE
MEMNVEQKIEGEVKRRNCNKSDASNADIPEEIQIEILSRLPPKSFSRFKCVSKHWNDTLTMQAFLLKHSRSYDEHSKLAFVARFDSWRKGSLISFEQSDDNVNTPEKPKTTASLVKGKDVYFSDLPIIYIYMSNICNDLTCLFHPYSTCPGLLNIKTHDFIRLPAIPIKPMDPISLPAIPIKPMDSLKIWYALGFDPVHKVFKVLSIIYDSRECTTTKAAILTVGSKYWNLIDYKCLPMWITTNSICLDGVIYWVHKNKIDNGRVVLTVGSFDLNREAFRDNELVTTTLRREWEFKYYLTCLKECPTLFIWKRVNDYAHKEVVVEQWTLFNHKNPNASWKRRIFTTSDFPIIFPYCSDGINVAGGSTLLEYSKMINSEYSWYLSYDLENFATSI